MNTDSTITEDAREFLADCAEQSRWRKGVSVGHVNVDGGSVEFAFGKTMPKWTFADEVDNISAGTATAGFNGVSGFVKTPDGDGRFEIFVAYDPTFSSKWFVGMIHIDRPATHMSFGDCGKIQLRVPLRKQPETVRLYWINEALWVIL